MAKGPGSVPDWRDVRSCGPHSVARNKNSVLDIYLLKYFIMRNIYEYRKCIGKYFLSFLKIYILAMPPSMWDLSFPARDEPEHPTVETWRLNRGPPGKSGKVIFKRDNSTCFHYVCVMLYDS